MGKHKKKLWNLPVTIITFHLNKNKGLSLMETVIGMSLMLLVLAVAANTTKLFTIQQKVTLEKNIDTQDSNMAMNRIVEDIRYLDYSKITTPALPTTGTSESNEFNWEDNSNSRYYKVYKRVYQDQDTLTIESKKPNSSQTYINLAVGNFDSITFTFLEQKKLQIVIKLKSGYESKSVLVFTNN